MYKKLNNNILQQSIIAMLITRYEHNKSFIIK